MWFRLTPVFRSVACQALKSNTKPISKTKLCRALVNVKYFSKIHPESGPRIIETDNANVEIDYSELETDPETTKEIQIILMEHCMAKDSGERVPTSISVKDMQELLKKGFHQRKKYMGYLFKNQVLAIQDKIKHKRRVEEGAKVARLKFEEEGDHLHYGLGKNTMFMMIRNKALDKFYSTRLSHAITFGQPLVYDFDFDEHMNTLEIKSGGQQLKNAYAVNKRHKEPFAMYFVNARMDQPSMMQVKRDLGNLENGSMITVTEKSYLDIFPREKLVYLTPDAPNMLTTYDHDAIYIIGALVDKGKKVPLTLAKAKREGIKMARLPLEKYLLWALGVKTLTLNHMLEILLDVKEHGDWQMALKKGVPSRKINRLENMSSQGNEESPALTHKLMKRQKSAEDLITRLDDKRDSFDQFRKSRRQEDAKYTPRNNYNRFNEKSNRPPRITIPKFND